MAGGYKLFSTGEVLTAANVNNYLMNQTVMVFASAAARTTALSGVLAEGMISYRSDAKVLEIYNGTTWVTESSFVSPLTTKGDVHTYSTTDARLPVGSDGQTLVANSAATTGLQWQTPVQQNPILNAAMQIWQRGTSIVGTATAYAADRWQAYRAVAGSTFSRQVTGDTTNLPNIQYCMRVQRDSGNTSTAGIQLAQTMETINSIPFVGKTVTFSFYARAGANYSNASNGLIYYLMSNTGVDQNVLTSFTPTTVIGQTATLTTTWQRFTYTGTVPSNSTQLGVFFYWTPVGTAGANDYYEMTGIQLEVGSVATPFHTFSTTLQGELAACQRYYYRSGGSATYEIFGWGIAASTNALYIQTKAPVTMRVAPTSVEYSSLTLVDQVGGSFAATAVGVNMAGKDITQVYCTVASGLTQFRSYYLTANNSTSAYLGFSAEL